MLHLVGKYKARIEYRGKRTWESEGHNLVTDSGKTHAADVLRANSGPSPVVKQFIRYLAIGDDATPPDVSQVALMGTELITRVDMVQAIPPGNNQLGYSVSYYHLGATFTGREFGSFDSIAGGTMFSRWLPSEFTLITGAVLTLFWTLEVG